VPHPDVHAHAAQRMSGVAGGYSGARCLTYLATAVARPTLRRDGVLARASTGSAH
jgi:hypothetical protein